MGPPLEAWREKIATCRHGEVDCEEMLCQLSTVRKFPKWSFGTRPKSARHPGGTGPETLHDKYRDAHGKFRREPGYSFPPPPRERPSSAPPGGHINFKLRPGTPQYSFGRTKRGGPDPKTDGPGPNACFSSFGGPKFSMGLRPNDGPKSFGPGPKYNPGNPDKKRAPVFGTGTGYGPKDNGVPGPYAVPSPMGGASYSLGVRREERPKSAGRLGIQMSQFGYNDFGHARCNC